MTLARERAISDAYLLSGDEDLREGVRAAQDMGVRVGLVGIATIGGAFNQSRELVHEADTTTVLAKSDLRPFFSSRTNTSSPVTPIDVEANVKSSAMDFAQTWMQGASLADTAALQAVRPVIPKPLDVDLLLFVEKGVGVSLADNETLRRIARKAFWNSVGK